MMESIIISTLTGSIVCIALLIFKNRILSLLGGKVLYYISLFAMLIFVLPMNIGEISFNKGPIHQEINVMEFDNAIPTENSEDITSHNVQTENFEVEHHNVLTKPSNILKNTNPVTIQEILIVIWLLVFVISMCRYFLAYFYFKKKICAFDIYGIIDGVEVIKSPLISSPLVFGFFRPTLAIPAVEMKEEDYNLAIKHEMVHYKHHDTWLKLFAVIVNSICWFNPITYFMVDLIGEACEYACDEQVTKEMDMTDRKQYSMMILSMVCQTSPALSSNMVRNKKQLKRRFEMIMKKKRFSVFKTIICIVVMLAVTGGSIVLANGVAPVISSVMKDDYVYITNFESGEYNNFVPVEKDGVYYLPLRAFLNSCSIENDKIKFDNGTITVDVWSEDVKFGGTVHIGDDNKIEHNEPEQVYPSKHIWSSICKIDSKKVTVGEHKFELENTPYMEDNITYVPYDYIKMLCAYEKNIAGKATAFNNWTSEFVSVMLYKYDSFESEFSCDNVEGDEIPGYTDSFQNVYNAYASISRTGYRTRFGMNYDFKDANNPDAEIGHVEVTLNEVTRVYSKGSDIEGLFTVKINDEIIYENEKGYITNLPIPAGEGTSFHNETHVKVGELRNRIFFKGFGNISDEYHEKINKNREMEKSPERKIVSLKPTEGKLNGIFVTRAGKNNFLSYVEKEKYVRSSLYFDNYSGKDEGKIDSYDIHQEEETYVTVLDENTFAGHYYLYDGLVRIDSFDAIITLLPDNKFEFRSVDGRYIVRGTTGDYTPPWAYTEEQRNEQPPQVVMIED